MKKLRLLGLSMVVAAWSTIPIRWTEVTRTLEIGERQGAFAGMPQERQFRVVAVGEGKEAGSAVATRPDAVLGYAGRGISKVVR